MTGRWLAMLTILAVAACGTERKAPADSATMQPVPGAPGPGDSVLSPSAEVHPSPDTTLAGSQPHPGRSTSAQPPRADTSRGAAPESSAAAPTSTTTRGNAPAPAAGTADTLRGTVHVVGSFPAVSVVLNTPERRQVPLDGQLTRALKNVSQTEVAARGTWLHGGRFQVDTFTVRRAAGEDVVDGVLVRENGGIALRTGSGTRRLGNPPAAFSNLIGARVWVGGPLDTGPNPYGVISRP